MTYTTNLIFIDETTDLEELLFPHGRNESDEEIADRVVNRGTVEIQLVDEWGDTITTDRPIPCSSQEYRTTYNVLHRLDYSRTTAESTKNFIDMLSAEIISLLSWWEVDIPADKAEIDKIRQSRSGSFQWFFVE